MLILQPIQIKNCYFLRHGVHGFFKNEGYLRKYSNICLPIDIYWPSWDRTCSSLVFIILAPHQLNSSHPEHKLLAVGCITTVHLATQLDVHGWLWGLLLSSICYQLFYWKKREQLYTGKRNQKYIHLRFLAGYTEGRGSILHNIFYSQCNILLGKHVHCQCTQFHINFNHLTNKFKI